MGLWDLYFIAKLYLYFDHHIGFHVWLNLGFALFLVLPIPVKYGRLKPLRLGLAIPIGLALFYYDTWLPPITEVFAKFSELEGFSLQYLLELVGRFFNPLVVAGLALAIAVYFLARKKVRVSSLVFIAMLVPLLSFRHAAPALQVDTANATSTDSGSSGQHNLTADLAAFFRSEAERSVSFSPPAKADTPFDIIFLHICSLSWDDIDYSKLRQHPIFKRFDILFTHFNSAASYSGPAVIRLLRSSCGQPRHKDLYDPPETRCLTIDQLQKVGYRPQLALNHDGQFGGFLKDDVIGFGGLHAQPFDASALPVYLTAFDGSPIHDDYAVLSHWWEKRLHSPSQRDVLYYNTISLHDGDQYPGPRTNSIQTYPTRLAHLFDDIDRFFTLLQKSGRKVVVVLVPEHGAAVRGDRMQIAGLRDIPSPHITTVPVGIKLIGFSQHREPLIVSQPSSFLAISKLLSEFVAISPFGNNRLSMADYARDLPTTAYVAENADVVVMRHAGQYYIRTKGADWIPYDSSD